MNNTSKYPWTESGKEILLHFETLIKNYGGREVLAREIEVKAPEFFGGIKRVKRVPDYRRQYVIKGKPYIDNDDLLIKDKWFDMTLEEIGALLGRSPQSISRRGKRIGFSEKPAIRHKKGGTRQAA